MNAAHCLRFPSGTRHLVPWLLPFFTALCIFAGEANSPRAQSGPQRGALRTIASAVGFGGEQAAGSRPRALKLLRAHGVPAVPRSRQKVSRGEFTVFETADLPSSDSRSFLLMVQGGGIVGVPDAPRCGNDRGRSAEEDAANAAARRALRSSYFVARPPPLLPNVA